MVAQIIPVPGQIPVPTSVQEALDLKADKAALGTAAGRNTNVSGGVALYDDIRIVGAVQSFYATATTMLSGHRVVKAVAGGVDYASSDMIGDQGGVLGITADAAGIGTDVRVVALGDMNEPTWAFISGRPVFLGLNGLLTQIVPSAGFIQPVGVATASTRIFVMIGPAIRLA